MTSTSVKEVGSVMNGLNPGSVSQTGNSSKASFQSVWNSQTGKGGQAKNPQTEKTVENRQTSKPGESLKAKDHRKLTESEKPEEVSDTQVQDVEELEKAMEVLGTAAVELVEEIAETFDISVEEVQDLMNQMEITATDLLDRNTLSTFLLEVSGAENSMTLLTNESLYQDFRQLMGKLETMLSQDSGIAGKSIGELNAELLEAGELAKQNPIAAETAETPVLEKTENLPIQVTVEEAKDEPDMDQPKSGEAQTVVEDTIVKQPNAEETAGKDAKPQDHREHSEGQEKNGNLFLQNLKADNADLQTVRTEQVQSRWSADTQDIMRQIMDYMRIQVKPDTSDLTMQLHPEHLGSLQIHVASKGGVVTANFITQNEAVKAALESQMVQLKENFEQQGVKVEAIEVTVQTHQFEQNLEQGQSRGQNEPEKRGRTRRIHLDGALSAEELTDMEEEEQLAAQMMAANGNTVDYTA